MGSKRPQLPPTDGRRAKPSAPPPRAKRPMKSNHEKLEALCRGLDVEMDGVSPIPATAAAYLNGIRSVLNDIDSELE